MNHLPYNKDLVSRAKELRKNMTPAEKKLWYEYLRTFQHRVHRQRPIDNYIVDFYCPHLKLVIEIDGESHYTKEAIEYDKIRTQILNGYGLKVIRFTNQEILQNLEGVCEKIEALIPKYSNYTKERHQFPNPTLEEFQNFINQNPN
ncbi:endonuclease domain-containing protein [Spirulina major]|uniref:endonuclease domain-containing protein n=1 Tax=Spirulina major TaxID=270636 RepID=UPI000A053E56|nr:endonuclease domain-containing protein [Spirulina major]